MEFKTEAFPWSPDLTKENHNTFINTANKIVQIVSKFIRVRMMKLSCLCIGVRLTKRHFLCFQANVQYSVNYITSILKSDSRKGVLRSWGTP